MDIKNFDGKEWVLKSDLETIIKNRIANSQAKIQEAENNNLKLMSELKKAQELSGIADQWRKQAEQMEQSLQKAEQKFNRFQAIASNGFTDPELVAATEWAYDRAMQGKDQKIPLSDWLSGLKAEPEKAPLILRPHLQNSPSPAVSVEPQTENPTKAEIPSNASPGSQNGIPPNGNNGVLAQPKAGADLIKMAARPESYAEFRDAIRNTYFPNSRG